MRKKGKGRDHRPGGFREFRLGNGASESVSQKGLRKKGSVEEASSLQHFMIVREERTTLEKGRKDEKSRTREKGKEERIPNHSRKEEMEVNLEKRHLTTAWVFSLGTKKVRDLVSWETRDPRVCSVNGKG